MAHDAYRNSTVTNLSYATSQPVQPYRLPGSALKLIGFLLNGSRRVHDNGRRSLHNRQSCHRKSNGERVAAVQLDTGRQGHAGRATLRSQQ